jgi:hypothetical protein
MINFVVRNLEPLEEINNSIKSVRFLDETILREIDILTSSHFWDSGWIAQRIAK